jgi:hypothetical protein
MKCIYCRNEADTDDHVPQKNLFPKPRPNNLITVPACKDCNKKYEKDDEYFRNSLVMSSDLENSNEANIILDNVLRSYSRVERQGMIKSFLKSSKIIGSVTNTGPI